MNNVPKGATERVAEPVVGSLSEEMQLEMLRIKLAGHKAFAKCRGRFLHLPYEQVMGAKEEPVPSPTQSLSRFGEWCSSRSVMFKMLATLRRDGHNVAHSELYRALTDSSFVITGEEIPLEQRESGVLIIPGLSDALLLARWLYTSTRDDASHWVKHGTLAPESHASPELTRKLFEVFPNFVRHFDEPWPSQEHRPYGSHTCPSWARKERLNAIYSKLFRHFGRYKFSMAQNVWIDYTLNGIRHEGWNNQGRIGYFVCDTDVTEVLSLFSRQEQDTFSVWRFSYPKCNARMFGTEDFPKGMLIGLHPDSEHQKWAKLWPCYTSTGCAHGFGAVLLGEKPLFSGEAEKTYKYAPLNGFSHTSGPELTREIEQQRLVVRLHWDN